MHARRDDKDQVKDMLILRLESLLAELVGGKAFGGYWFAPSPLRADAKQGTFWVSLRRQPGFWKEESQGVQGDILDLIQRTQGLHDFAAVMDWARDWLGLDTTTDRQRDETARRAAARSRERAGNFDASQTEMLDRQRGQAQARWLKSQANVTGTPVATYLAGRGIDIRRLARMSNAIRYDADGLHRETGELLPVMRVMMTLPDGKFGALHSTFMAVRRDGSVGKADVTPVRKIWPSYAGAAMRLARGKSGLDVMTAGERGVREPLVLCEGVEDGLSIALMYPDLRVWAVGALGNFAHQVLPACCEEVIIAADNDWNKPQATKLLHSAIAKLAKGGDMPVSVMRSPVGKDFNDALQARARVA